MKELLKSREGDMLFLLICIIVGVLGLSLVVDEYLKVNGIADHVELEMNRAVNLGIKEAVHDSWRQDYKNKLDPAVARDGFYNYLHNELGLDSNGEKHGEGQKTYLYRIDIQEIEVDGETAQMKVKAVTYVPCMMKGLPEWELPVNVRSRNMRVDGKEN